MAYQRKLYQAFASRMDALIRCRNSGTLKEWEAKHADYIEDVLDKHLPSGSGFDNGSRLNQDMSTGERLVFDTAFHHMDEHGYYDGWTECQVIVKAHLIFGFDLRVTGRNRNGIKEYIADTFRDILNTITEE